MRETRPMQLVNSRAAVDRIYAETGRFQWAREAALNSIEARATRIHFGLDWNGVQATGTYRRFIADNGSRDRHDDEREQYLRARLAWNGIPMAERGHRVLNIIGGGRLTIRQVHERLASQMPEARIYQADVRTVVRLLHQRGELDRAAEPVRPGGASIRYRYFRRAMDPQLAGLDRQLNGGEGS